MTPLFTYKKLNQGGLYCLTKNWTRFEKMFVQKKNEKALVSHWTIIPRTSIEFERSEYEGLIYRKKMPQRTRNQDYML